MAYELQVSVLIECPPFLDKTVYINVDNMVVNIFGNLHVVLSFDIAS